MTPQNVLTADNYPHPGFAPSLVCRGFHAELSLSTPPCRSRSPSQAQQFAHHQRDAGRGWLGDGPSQLDPAGGARHSHPSLQSLLELDRPHQVHGAVQKEAEEDHQRGNLSAPAWTTRSFLSLSAVVVVVVFLIRPRMQTLIQDYLSTFFSSLAPAAV